MFKTKSIYLEYILIIIKSKQILQIILMKQTKRKKDRYKEIIRTKSINGKHEKRRIEHEKTEEKVHNILAQN